LKVVHPICAGIDIHKKSFTVAIATTKKDGTYSTKVKTFSTMQKGITQGRLWIIENKCYTVALESTGKYWIPVYDRFEDFFDLTLANPRFTKTFPGNKTDRRDAKWLSELHRIGLVAKSFIPPRDIRELRELTRYRVKLIKMRSSEKNRAHNSLIISNIMLSSVATDIFGKSGMNIIEALIAGTELDEQALSTLVCGKLRSKIPDLLEALDGTLSQLQKDKIRIILDNFISLSEKIAKLELLILEKVKPHQQIIDLLCSLPGIKSTAAIGIIAEIGVDMSAFYSDKHLCSWAGVSPQNYQSAGKRKNVPAKSGNGYLTSMLVQCANAAVKEANSWLTNRFESIQARRGRRKAIIATCRSMLTAIYHIISTKEPYREPQKTSYISASKEKKLIAQLQSLGYKVEKLAS